MNISYKIKIYIEDICMSQFIKSFDSENQLREFVMNYLDGNSHLIVEVLNLRGKRLHRYEMCIGSHNQLTLFDFK